MNAHFVSLALFLLATPTMAVTLYQQDTFASGLQDWKGSNTHMFWREDGGPNGTGDGYMEVNSTGTGGPGSRWVVFNQVQWTGDFPFQPVEGIRFDVNNTGSTAVNLRVVFGDSNGPDDNSGSWFASTVPIVIQPGSGWTSVYFPLSDNDLVSVQGPEEYDDLMGVVQTMRILSSANPAAKGDRIAAQVGIDNIQAVPEPTSGVLILAGVFLCIKRRR